MFELTIPLRLIIVTVVVVSIVLSIMNYVITKRGTEHIIPMTIVEILAIVIPMTINIVYYLQYFHK
jgi:VIT1/CCC1 family predicted Fe2+/Mn2+ transporter